MKQIEVTILGQSYRLMCPDDGEASLREAVGIVDQEMSAIRDAGKVKARECNAVLAALNLAYRLAERGSSSGAPSTGLPPAQNGSSRVVNDTVDRLVQRIDRVLGNDGHLI